MKLADDHRELWPFLVALGLQLTNYVYHAHPLSYAVSIAYAAVIVGFAVAGQIETAVLLHVVAIASSLEFPLGGEEELLITYRTVSVAGVSLSTIVTATLVFMTVPRAMSVLSLRGRARSLTLIVVVLVLLLSALITGAAATLLGLYSTAGFLKDLNYYTILVGSLFVFSLNIRDSVRAARSVTSILMASAISPLLAFFVFGVQGQYGGAVMFPFTVANIYTPLLLFVPMRSGTRVERFLWVLCIVAGITGNTVFAIAGGKGILVILVALVLKLVSRPTSVAALATKVIFPPIALLITISVFASVTSSDDPLLRLARSKTKQATAVLSVGEWLEDPYSLPRSPRVRLLEALNIGDTLIRRKPHLLFLGAGFGGYFSDLSFPIYDRHLPGTFSDDQLKTRQYYAPHESFNAVLLKFGIVGLLIWASLVFWFFRRGIRDGYGHQSVATFVAAIWVTLFIGFSLSHAMFGAFALVVSEAGNRARSRLRTPDHQLANRSATP